MYTIYERLLQRSATTVIKFLPENEYLHVIEDVGGCTGTRLEGVLLSEKHSFVYSYKTSIASLWWVLLQHFKNHQFVTQQHV